MTLGELSQEILDLMDRHQGQLTDTLALAALGLVTSLVLSQIEDRERRIEIADAFGKHLLDLAKRQDHGHARAN